MGPKIIQFAYLLSSSVSVEDADEDGDDAVAAHELTVVGRGGHGLEGERHLLEVAAAQHGHQRVDAFDLALEGLVPVTHALPLGVDGRGEAHHGGRVVMLQINKTLYGSNLLDNLRPSFFLGCVLIW